MNSQRLKPEGQGPLESVPDPLRMYYGFQLSVSAGFLSVGMSGPLILVLSPRIFSFSWVVLSNFSVIASVLPSTLFCYILILCLRSLFSRER